LQLDRAIDQTVAGLSARRFEHDPRSVFAGFVVDKAAVEQVILRVLWICLVSIIQTVLHTHLHLHISLTRRTNVRNLDISSPPPPKKKSKTFFGNCGALDRKVHPQVFLRVPRFYSANIIPLRYTKLNMFILGSNFFRHFYKILKQNLIMILKLWTNKKLI
jgi:hypothetical protein